MIVFKSAKTVQKGKITFEKSLNRRLIDTNQSSIYVFPFFLFTKSFYKDFRESRKGVFVGKIENDQFEIEPSSKIFSTRTWFPLKLKGSIENNSVKVKYLVSNLFLTLIGILAIVDMLFISAEEKLDSVFLVLPIIVFVIYLIKIQRINHILNKLCE